MKNNEEAHKRIQQVRKRENDNMIQKLRETRTTLAKQQKEKMDALTREFQNKLSMEKDRAKIEEETEIAQSQIRQSSEANRQLISNVYNRFLIENEINENLHLISFRLRLACNDWIIENFRVRADQK